MGFDLIPLPRPPHKNISFLSANSVVTLYVLWALILLWLTGCNTPPTPTVTPDDQSLSLWGEIFTVGHAEQAGAPAAALLPDGIALAWIGADETGVHQDARILKNAGMSERVVLPLPPVHPYDQRLLPAEVGGIHFLWLDAENDSASESRMFSAFINSRLENELGPIQVSDRATLHYDDTANSDGSLWTVWSGGLVIEPGLYATYIDASGRPRSPQYLTSKGDYPALLQTADGSILLFWMQVLTDRVYRAKLGDGVLSDIQPVTTAPRLGRGDRLIGMNAGVDNAQGYIFWNITRADGFFETWYAHGALAAEEWSSPERLGIRVVVGEIFVTGYNSGTTQEAASGDTWVAWGSPASGQYDVLALAGQVGDDLGVVYFSGGEVVGYQAIVPLPEHLIGAPRLLTDRSRHLYLSWAEPNMQGYSQLKFTQTAR